MKMKKLRARKKNTKAAGKQKKSNEPQDLVRFFAESPLAEANLDLERTPDYGKELKLFSGPTQR